MKKPCPYYRALYQAELEVLTTSELVPHSLVPCFSAALCTYPYVWVLYIEGLSIQIYVLYELFMYHTLASWHNADWLIWCWGQVQIRLTRYEIYRSKLTCTGTIFMYFPTRIPHSHRMRLYAYGTQEIMQFPNTHWYKLQEHHSSDDNCRTVDSDGR